MWATMIGLDLSDEGVQALLLPIASAAGWLGKGRTRRTLGLALARRAAVALTRASAAMNRIGEERAAADLREAAVAMDAPSGSLAGEVADQARGSEGPAALARRITATVDRHVRCTSDGVAVLDGWTVADAGRPVEVHDAETPWGRVGYAIRWHGRRPALLWEAVDAAGPLRWTCPSIDPSWSSLEPTGETLLAEPAGLPEQDLVEATVEVLSAQPDADGPQDPAAEGPAPGDSFA
jgi:hypothetical protein